VSSTHHVIGIDDVVEMDDVIEMDHVGTGAPARSGRARLGKDF
jgi:hypothetical protein